MSILVESLKRLYAKGRITESKLDSMVELGRITAEEKIYIMQKGE